MALRKEIVAVAPENTGDGLDAPAEIETASLDPIAGAAAVLADPAPAAPPTPRSSSLDKPFIQIGIFSVEANANRTATQMRSAGLIPTIKPGERAGKPFWRVVVGPATSASERATLLNTIKDQGFADAYAVSN